METRTQWGDMAEHNEVQDIELGSSEFWDALREDPAMLAAQIASIDLVDIQTTMQRHPGLRAWVAASYESARIEEERLKWRLQKVRGEVMVDASNIPDQHTGKKKTVAVLEAEVDAHPEVQAAQEDLLDVQHRRGVLRALNSALDDRRDMLIQIAARQREEARDYNR